MSDCTPEFWTLKDIKESLEKEYNGKKKIVIPMFQRGKRWNKEKKDTFIDSLRKKYPVGTLLFYKTNEGNQEIYTLIDGLQRGTAIKEYLSKPTKFFCINELSDESLDKIYSLIISNGNEELQKSKINSIIQNYVNSLDSYDDLELFELFNITLNDFPILNNKSMEFCNSLKNDFKSLKDDYTDLCGMRIPAIVYTGEEETLPEIFERINSKGVALTEYEIYAASWPRQEFYVENEQIVEYVLKKYDMLNDSEYAISGYDRETRRKNKLLNSFEYVFGLSKYLQNKFDSLKFYKNLKDDETNPVAFQLINACFNTSHSQIKDVHKAILQYSDNIKILEDALISSIEFVNNCIGLITKFKGNSRKQESKIFHSQYQIMSLISFVFRKKYLCINNVIKVKESWKIEKHILEKNIWKFYVYDIVTKYWGEGGTTKIHSANMEDRYFNLPSNGQFSTAYDAYSESQLNRREIKNVANPNEIDIVILNTIYLNLFSAMDQLYVNNFDVEHIATKDQMKKLIGVCNGDGLPISHLANLCYLPEFENRSKGANNIYQDLNYLNKSNIRIETIEQKYSFTKKEDLEFMELNYTIDDFDSLKDFYIKEFLKERNEIIKQKFLESLGCEKIDNVKEKNNIVFDEKYFRMTKIGKMIQECFEYLIGNDLIDNQIILLLKDKDYSIKKLGCAFPVLLNEESKLYDSNNYRRYYEKPMIYKGEKLFLCKEWYEHDRKLVVPWMKSIMGLQK